MLVGHRCQFGARRSAFDPPTVRSSAVDSTAIGQIAKCNRYAVLRIPADLLVVALARGLYRGAAMGCRDLLLPLLLTLGCASETDVRGIEPDPGQPRGELGF